MNQMPQTNMFSSLRGFMTLRAVEAVETVEDTFFQCLSSNLQLKNGPYICCQKMRKKKVWLLEPIPTKKYVPIPQQEKLR